MALGQRAQSLSENSLSSSGHSGALHICAQRRAVLRYGGGRPSFTELRPHFIYCSQLHKESFYHATNTDAASRSTRKRIERIFEAFAGCLLAAQTAGKIPEEQRRAALFHRLVQLHLHSDCNISAFRWPSWNSEDLIFCGLWLSGPAAAKVASGSFDPSSSLCHAAARRKCSAWFFWRVMGN